MITATDFTKEYLSASPFRAVEEEVDIYGMGADKSDTMRDIYTIRPMPLKRPKKGFPYMKKCFVDGCMNTSETDKIFVFVPENKARRKEWFAAARAPWTSRMSHCCEDHFNLEEDAENWHYFRFIGAKIKIKPGIVPHLRLDSSLSTPSAKSQLDENLRLEKKERLDNMVVPTEPEIMVIPVDVVPEMMTHPDPLERNCVKIEEKVESVKSSEGSSCDESVPPRRNLPKTEFSDLQAEIDEEKKLLLVKKDISYLERKNDWKRKRLKRGQTRRKNVRNAELEPKSSGPNAPSQSFAVHPKRSRKLTVISREHDEQPDYLDPADLPPNYVYCSCLTGMDVN